MISKKAPRFVLLFACVCLTANEVLADLMTSVSGVSGAGFSTWTFSGQDNVVSPGSHSFAGDNNVAGGFQGWEGIGSSWSAVATISDNIAATSTDATVTIGGTTANLTRVRYGNNIGGFLGFASDHAGSISLSDGQSVSWTGTMQMPIDVNSVSSFSSNEFAGLDLQFNVVPEPSAFTLFYAAAGLLVACRWRNCPR